MRFRQRPSKQLDEWIERRLYSPSVEKDDLDLLATLPPEGVLEWMEFKARLADGTEPWLPILPVEFAMDAIHAERRLHTGRIGTADSRSSDGWLELVAGVLREACGLSVAEIALRSHVSTTAVRDRLQRHGRLLAREPEYARVLARAIHRALQRLPGVDSGNP